MALKTYPNVPMFSACILKQHTITDAEATANSVDISFDRPVTAVMFQIQAASTGVVYATGISAVITTVTTEGSESCKVTIAGTDLAKDAVINVIAW